MTVGELSEGEILARIVRRTGRSTSAVVGPGDDAAVLRISGDTVATTDTLVHGPDFRLAWSSGYDLGWKATAVNLADVAAMGAQPAALLVALAMPNDTAIELVEQLADGLRDTCDALAPGCAVVGGDLTVSNTLTIAVTAIGDLEGREPVLRSGAAPGDVVAVAGELGRSGLGGSPSCSTGSETRPSSRSPFDRTASAQASGRCSTHSCARHRRLGLGTVAARSGATAMMDVSDGLALDASRMARASGVAISFDSSALGSDVHAAMTGGEDHELLTAFPDDALPPGFRARDRPRDDGSG